MRILFIVKIAAISFLFFMSSASSANAILFKTYTYSGHQFTNFNGSFFSSNDKVTGSMTIACSGSIAGDCKNYPYSYNNIYWVKEINLSAGPVNINTFSLSGLDNIEFSTDSDGNIDRWSIYLRYGWAGIAEDGRPYPTTIPYESISTSSHNSYVDGAYRFESTPYVSQGSTSIPGTWTMTAVPLPAAFWLFLSGLASLFYVYRSQHADVG